CARQGPYYAMDYW
nr:immunoglobulin heavy chain junction region [Mus musculus]MBK4184182.1 immunoglobulin heavy chain junction region [Mus musculus]MBK4184183.1 immunoglobulin heavy chain junction region [Mus musculus]